MSLTDDFIESINAFSSAEFAEKHILAAKKCVIDYIACANLGNLLREEQNRQFLKGFIGDQGNVRVIGSEVRVPKLVGAMVNGMNAHEAELDDGCRFAMMHLEAPIISTLFSEAANGELNADKFLRGIIIGYEAAIRMAAAIQPGHKKRGFHSTGTCGTIGGAIALAAIRGYDIPKMKTVLSAAASDAASLLGTNDDGSQIKSYNAGRAAVAALNAANMGYSDLSGPIDILAGKRGFFVATADEVHTEKLINGFLPVFAIELIYRKIHASCRHSHAAVDAALNIVNDHIVNTDAIKEIIIETYDLAILGHDHNKVVNVNSAKMSIPFAVAVAMINHNAGYDQFNMKTINDPKINALAGKVSVIENKELSKLVPEKRAAIVHVITDDDHFTEHVDYPKGEPENPVNLQELETKYFSSMRAAGKDDDYSRYLLECMLDLENRFDDFINIV